MAQSSALLVFDMYKYVHTYVPGMLSIPAARHDMQLEGIDFRASWLDQLKSSEKPEEGFINSVTLRNKIRPSFCEYEAELKHDSYIWLEQMLRWDQADEGPHGPKYTLNSGLFALILSY